MVKSVFILINGVGGVDGGGTPAGLAPESPVTKLQEVRVRTTVSKNQAQVAHLCLIEL